MLQDTEKRNKNCKFTIKEEKEILQLYYEDKLSYAKISKLKNCNPSTIMNIVKAYGLSGRTLSEARRNALNYTIDETVFENIDALEKAYWLGVMYSDGYVTTNKYTKYFGISVQADDVQWLEKFKIFLNYNGEIHHYKTGSTSYKPGSPYVRLQVGNTKIVKDLEKLGVVENKTKLIGSIPNIKFKDDFIRGVIDGDGALIKRTPRLIISGNKDFLEDIAKYFNLPYSLYQDKSIYSLQYNKQETVYLENRLYKNACAYLDRKYNIAKRSF